MLEAPAGFIVARAARGFLAHLVPFDGERITNHAARCGWKQNPRGNAPHRWYRVRGVGAVSYCPKCFPEIKR